MKSTLLASLLLISTFATAATSSKQEELTIETFEISQTDTMKLGSDVNGAGGGGGAAARIEQAGQIIATAKDFVALGEQIYSLVQKGKPTVTTTHAPISVVPKDPTTKEVIEPFELEGFSMPVQKKFSTILKVGSREVGRFDYMVTYSYGGSYNGTGKWITGAEIIPIAVKTNFGWDFTATMKVSSIMNHGTKADPVAGVILIVKYTMNSWRSAQERNDTFHITGSGEFQTFTNK